MSHLHPAVVVLLLSGLVIFWVTPLSAWLLLSGQRDRNARIWFTGTALYAMVATIFVFGGSTSLAWRLPLTTVMSTCSVLCLMESLRREISHRPPPWAKYAMLLLLEMGCILALQALTHSTDVATAFHLALISAVEVMLIRLTLQVRAKHHSRALWLVMVMLVAFIAANLSRSLELWLTGRFSLLTDFTFLASASLMVNYLSVVCYCYGYWGFVVEKNQALLVEATTQTLLARQGEIQARHQEQLAKDMLRERTELLERLAAVGKIAQSGALSASIAHEINQPLAAIQLNVQQARHWASDFKVPELLQKLLARIEQDNQRTADVVKRVRAMFRHSPEDMEPQDLAITVQTVLRLIEGRIQHEKVHVHLALDTHKPVWFAKGEMEHILLNLLTNALDAMQHTPESERTVRIDAWQNDSGTHLAVTDSGPGVDPEQRHRIFELTATSKSDGMGLGLWLARYIVERHGGSLTLKEAHTHGACFVMRLPPTNTI